VLSHADMFGEKCLTKNVFSQFPCTHRSADVPHITTIM